MKDGEIMTHTSSYREELSENELIVGVKLASDRFNRPIHI